MSYFVNGSLFTKVLPLCGCLTFLKANDSPGLQTRIVDLWTCAQCAGGPLREVFLCTCTGLICFVVVAVVIAGAEGGPERSLRLCHLCYIHCMHCIGHCIGIVLVLFLLQILQDLEDVGCTS